MTVKHFACVDRALHDAIANCFNEELEGTLIAARESFHDLWDSSRWQPMETAPKDGTSILAVTKDDEVGMFVWDGPGSRCETTYGEGGNWRYEGRPSIALHGLKCWMPKPKPPIGDVVDE